MDSLGSAILKTVAYLNNKGSSSTMGDVVAQMAEATLLEKKVLEPLIKEALIAGSNYGYVKQYKEDYYTLDETDIKALLGVTKEDVGSKASEDVKAMEVQLEWVPHTLAERKYNAPVIEDGSGGDGVVDSAGGNCVEDGVGAMGLVDEITCPLANGVSSITKGTTAMTEDISPTAEDISLATQDISPVADCLTPLVVDGIGLMDEKATEPQLELDAKFIQDLRNLVRSTCGACRKRKGKRGRSAKRRGRRGGRRRSKRR